MEGLTFFDAGKLNKSDVDKAIEEFLDMDINKACKVKGSQNNLSTLKNKLYNNYPGCFRIHDHRGFGYLIVRKKKPLNTEK